MMGRPQGLCRESIVVVTACSSLYSAPSALLWNLYALHLQVSTVCLTVAPAGIWGVVGSQLRSVL